MKKLSWLLAALVFASPAFADSTINNLGAGAAVQGTDILPAYQGANPATGVTATQLKTFMGGGTVTSIATSCGVSGGTITTTGTIKGAATFNAQTGTSYAMQDSDCGKIVTLSNGSAVAVSIAQAGGGGSFAATWFATIKNLGAGTVTITPATSTIDGAATLALTTNQSIDLYSDGTNYVTGRGIGGSTTDASLLTSGTLAAARMPALTGNCNTTAGAVATTCDYPTAGYSTSLWVLPYSGMTNGGATGTSPTASTIYCTYGAVAQKVTIGNLGFSITTLAASGNVQLAIYTNASNRPGTLLSSTASQTTAAAGSFSLALAANKQVGPGGSDGGRDIWWCINADASAGGTVKFQGVLNGSIFGPAMLVGSTTLANVVSRFGSNMLGVSCAGANCNGGSSTFGSWPANLAGSTWTDLGSSIAPYIAFQPASVP